MGVDDSFSLAAFLKMTSFLHWSALTFVWIFMRSWFESVLKNRFAIVKEFHGANAKVSKEISLWILNPLYEELT